RLRQHHPGHPDRWPRASRDADVVAHVHHQPDPGRRDHLHIDRGGQLLGSAHGVAGSQAIYEGNGELVYDMFEMIVPGCEVLGSSFLPGTSQAQLVVDAAAGSLEVFFDPGVPIETVQVRCNGENGEGNFSIWRDGWELLHGADFHDPSAPSGYPYRFVDLDAADMAVGVRTWEDTLTAMDVDWIEATSLRIE